MYKYYEAMMEDVKEMIRTYDACGGFYEIDSIDELADWIQETAWDDDSVTGNASGSYTFSTSEAKKNVLDNLDLLKEMAEAFGETEKIGEHFLNGDWEYFDVSIRCYLLGEVAWTVATEMIGQLREEAKAA